MTLRVLRALVFLAGCAAIAYGVSLIYFPAGVVAAGLFICLIAVLAEKDSTDHELVDEIRRRIRLEKGSSQ